MAVKLSLGFDTILWQLTSLESSSEVFSDGSSRNRAKILSLFIDNFSAVIFDLRADSWLGNLCYTDTLQHGDILMGPDNIESAVVAARNFLFLLDHMWSRLCLYILRIFGLSGRVLVDWDYLWFTA